jgi:hypothetical protein
VKKIIPLCLLLGAGCAGRAVKVQRAVDARLVPAAIATDAPAMDGLTAALRGRAADLGLNGLPGLNGGTVSRALVLLPHDRSNAGVISFRIEKGQDAGVWQCEVLGRGDTSYNPRPGWTRGLINGTTIYYAPGSMPDGATLPGVYDLRNITRETYELVTLDRPAELAGEDEFLAKVKNPDGAPKPYFSAVYSHWYNKGSAAVPVDLMWDEAYNPDGPKVTERRSRPSSPEAAARQAAQLAHNPRYYYGPYGRSGWAVHTDRWDAPERAADPRYAARPELKDFRFRDTSGCLKLRPGCLRKLNEFITDQEVLGRKVQLEVIETPLLDAVPQGPAAAR